MTQQLAKPKAQELLKDLQYAKAQMGQLSTKEEYYKQALEFLLPLWVEDEQQPAKSERKGGSDAC